MFSFIYIYMLKIYTSFQKAMIYNIYFLKFLMLSKAAFILSKYNTNSIVKYYYNLKQLFMFKYILKYNLFLRLQSWILKQPLPSFLECR